MVLEYYSLGSLDDVLHRQRMQLSVGQCLSIALDVALGMRFVSTHSLLDELKLQMCTMHLAFEYHALNDFLCELQVSAQPRRATSRPEAAECSPWWVALDREISSSRLCKNRRSVCNLASADCLN